MTNRLSSLRKIVKDFNVDAFLVTKPENIYYLSGLKATKASLLVTNTAAYLLVDSRYYLKAIKSTTLSVKMLDHSLVKFLKEFLARKKINKLAVEANYLTMAQAKDLKKNVLAKVIEANDWVEELRQIKDNKEINALRKAAKLADKAIAFAKHSVSLGITELQLAKRIECFIRQSGARSESFETIVASGPNSALPHHSSEKRHIRPGDSLVIDLGVKLDSYVSDITRTFIIQPAKPYLQELYLTCYRAQKEALKKVDTGISFKDIDKAARSLTEKKYPAKFLHNLGHGIGLELHEKPVLGPNKKGQIAENMVFTIEPGIYLEGKAGMRIEDMVWARKDGCKLLTTSSKHLQDIIIEL